MIDVLSRLVALSPYELADVNAAVRTVVFGVTALIFIADFVPRVYAGLAALGISPPADPVDWDHDTEPAELLLNTFAPTVGRMRALDSVTTEVIRLNPPRR